MKKTLYYAVLGNANIAADGMASVIRTSWLRGEVRLLRKYEVEIPNSLLENVENYVKNHTAEDFLKNVICPHNPKTGYTISSKIGAGKGKKLEYSPKYKMLRILGFYNNGLFIEL